MNDGRCDCPEPPNTPSEKYPNAGQKPLEHRNVGMELSLAREKILRLEEALEVIANACKCERNEYLGIMSEGSLLCLIGKTASKALDDDAVRP